MLFVKAPSPEPGAEPPRLPPPGLGRGPFTRAPAGHRTAQR
ncbi:hypothetical protein SFR_4369 [Streptomyces sp. FR-008]|nr:hypothetical protein SFR_4369 [Streptomyces sp. FR-008]